MIPRISSPSIPLQTSGAQSSNKPVPGAALTILPKDRLVTGYNADIEIAKTKYSKNSLERFALEEAIKAIDNGSFKAAKETDEVIGYSWLSDGRPPTDTKYAMSLRFEKTSESKLRLTMLSVRENGKKISIPITQPGAVPGDCAPHAALAGKMPLERARAQSLYAAFHEGRTNTIEQEQVSEMSEIALGKRPRHASSSEPGSPTQYPSHRPRTEAPGAAGSLQLRLHPVTADSLEKLVVPYVKENFAAGLKSLVTVDFTKGKNLTPKQKADNTYRCLWILPWQYRVSAALIQTAKDACNALSIDVAENNLHQIMEAARKALTMPSDESSAINRSLSDAHALTNDSNEAPTLQKLLMHLPTTFTNMSKVNEIFARVVKKIEEIDPNMDVEPTQLWEHQGRRLYLDSLRELKIIEHDNPFLPYLFDSVDEASLWNTANAWDFITEQARTDMTSESLTNLMIRLWAIFSSKATSADNTPISLSEENANYTILMEVADNAPHGTITAAGKEELLRKIADYEKNYGLTVTLGKEMSDRMDSKEYGRQVVTLERDDVSTQKLMQFLKAASKECIDQMDAANEATDEHRLLAAEAKLAMDVTQFRMFPGKNINVAMMLINYLRLKNYQPVPLSLSNPDRLDGHSLQEIVAEMIDREGQV